MIKREGTITINTMDSKTCPNLKFSVDFDGHNEGSGTPLETEEEVNSHVEYLLKQHKDYKLKIIDKRIKFPVWFLSNQKVLF